MKALRAAIFGPLSWRRRLSKPDVGSRMQHPTPPPLLSHAVWLLFLLRAGVGVGGGGHSRRKRKALGKHYHFQEGGGEGRGRGVCWWSKLSLVKRITRVRRSGGRKEGDSPMEDMNTFPCGREQGTISVLQSVFSLGNAGSPAFYFRTSSFFFLALVWERGFVRSLTPPPFSSLPSFYLRRSRQVLERWALFLCGGD